MTDKHLEAILKIGTTDIEPRLKYWQKNINFIIHINKKIISKINLYLYIYLLTGKNPLETIV